MSRVLRADHSQVLESLLLKGPLDPGAVLGKSNGFSNIAELVVRPSEVKQGRRGEPGVGFQIGQRGPNRFVGLGELALLHRDTADEPVRASAQSGFLLSGAGAVDQENRLFGI